MPVISELGELGQEDPKFKVILATKSVGGQPGIHETLCQEKGRGQRILPQQPSADSLPGLKLFVEDRQRPVWLRGARLGPMSSLYCSLARLPPAKKKVGRAALWSKQLSIAAVGFTGAAS